MTLLFWSAVLLFVPQRKSQFVPVILVVFQHYIYIYVSAASDSNLFKKKITLVLLHSCTYAVDC